MCTQDLQTRLQAEQALTQELRKQMDGVLRGSNSPIKPDDSHQSRHVEMVKNLATAEQVAKELRTQLEAKDTEFKRYRAESMSGQKRLEKVRIGAGLSKPTIVLEYWLILTAQGFAWARAANTASPLILYVRNMTAASG